MKSRFMILILIFTSLFAHAAGDAPRALDAKYAQAAVAQFAASLNYGCPGSQRAVSGLVTGGDSPMGGSQTISIAFDGGATVTILKSWGRPLNDGQTTSSVSVRCSTK